MNSDEPYWSSLGAAITANNATGTKLIPCYLIEPQGICGAIARWRYPLVTFVFKMVSALCPGDRLVDKSSKITPLSAIRLVSPIKKAGSPPGGPYCSCRKIMAAASKVSLKKVTLELGGNLPALSLMMLSTAGLRVYLGGDRRDDNGYSSSRLHL
ncbi:hypothetical protein BCR43DRAFT_521829 [Syncephalastrum racemosum]|uniref:Aldehyde dehydrogenase domain-containing protein n=1 Tax=Syncephalastrum racemosum TaxID=13706 RepID=A0A1X2HNE4_SYNRA|nr:hypothetical protein BCR43DRAFT_521829 [Syncephalastrum racemosum]